MSVARHGLSPGTDSSGSEFEEIAIHGNRKWQEIAAMAQRKTRYLALMLLAVIAVGCDSGVIVHDKDRAAELIVDFLTAIKSDEGIKLSYAWTDDRYKENISANQFTRIVARIRRINRGARIQLVGYEVFGPVELINVYARSRLGEEMVFYRFVLTGTRTKDYYLLKLDVDDLEFSKEGSYSNYQHPLYVNGV